MFTFTCLIEMLHGEDVRKCVCVCLCMCVGGRCMHMNARVPVCGHTGPRACATGGEGTCTCPHMRVYGHVCTCVCEHEERPHP